ncbi:MAG: HAMP domain-containing protein [Chloroflexi bacterium]|nr:HAMP domain-containing protein [Chloroflexota bacterium]
MERKISLRQTASLAYFIHLTNHRIRQNQQELGLENTLSLLVPLIVWIVGLIVVVTAFMIGIALAMSQDVHQLAGNMVTAMHNVAAGDINAHLDVTTTDEFAALYTGFNRMTQGLRERLHDAFGRYISPELAEQVMANGVSMSGKIVTASVLFVDIRDYTALSERMTATEIVALLNRYFALVEPVIQTEGGWINKFTGDGFMALFDVPVPHNNHAQRAVRASLAICQALDSFNQEQHASDGPVLQIGIGIACGDMVAGSIGSPDRIEYTVIGDTVNVAARIESLNKELGTTVLVSDDVYQAVQNTVDAQAMPPTMVKGKSAPVHVYALSK